jgi:hypothetical protein
MIVVTSLCSIGESTQPIVTPSDTIRKTPFETCTKNRGASRRLCR